MQHKLIVPAIAVAMVWLCVFVPSSDASIVYLTQSRTVQIQGFVNNAEQGTVRIASDYGPFVRSSMETFAMGSGTGSASQNSSLLANAINMQGTGNVTISTSALTAQCFSTCELTFRVTENTRAVIEHSHFTMGVAGTARALARLTGPGGQLFEWSENRGMSSTWPSANQVSIQLASGDYLLRLESFASNGGLVGNFGTNTTAISFMLTVPEPALSMPLLGLAATNCHRRRREKIAQPPRDCAA